MSMCSPDTQRARWASLKVPLSRPKPNRFTSETGRISEYLHRLVTHLAQSPLVLSLVSNMWSVRLKPTDGLINGGGLLDTSIKRAEQQLKSFSREILWRRRPESQRRQTNLVGKLKQRSLVVLGSDRLASGTFHTCTVYGVTCLKSSGNSGALAVCQNSGIPQRLCSTQAKIKEEQQRHPATLHRYTTYGIGISYMADDRVNFFRRSMQNCSGCGSADTLAGKALQCNLANMIRLISFPSGLAVPTNCLALLWTGIRGGSP